MPGIDPVDGNLRLLPLARTWRRNDFADGSAQWHLAVPEFALYPEESVPLFLRTWPCAASLFPSRRWHVSCPRVLSYVSYAACTYHDIET